jgi:GDPmannose 4,6-dehydratase
VSTALVTGAAGQDGSYLCEQLLAEGHEVHGLVRAAQQDGLGDLLDGVVLHDVELTDGAALGALVADVSPDEVYNLAALSSVAQSWSEPVLTARVNALAVAELLQACLAEQGRSGRAVHVVQASSAEIFGAAPAPQDETTPLAPTNPYGVAKSFAHQLVGVYRTRGLAASSCVLYNHESPRRPETFVTRKITSTVARIARGEADELSLGNLEVRRDWGWAPDYVDALVRAARYNGGLDVVIATGVAHTVRDFVAASFAAAGISDWEHLVSLDPRFARPSDAPEQRGDPARAQALLGWVPTTGFEKLVARMVAVDLAPA